MPTITLLPGWSGGTGAKPNHESSLGEDEMKALVLRILGIPGITDDAQIKHDRIKRLVTALQSATDDVSVLKGVHERDTNIHFTVALPAVQGGMHVWVKEGATTFVPSAPAADNGKVAKISMFSYQPVGISLEIAPYQYANFPTTFVLTNGRSNKGIGRPRGSSFSAGNKTTAGNTPPTMAQRMVGLVNPPPQAAAPV